MADDVTLELGGKKRQLRFDMNALAALEERLDVTIDQLPDLKFGIRTIRAFLWAGLLHENRDLDELDVGEWITPDNLEDVSQQIIGAFGQVYSEGKA